MRNIQRGYTILLCILSLNISAQDIATPLQQLKGKKWFSGAKNCQLDKSAAFETYQYNQNTFILRQNKCHHYEAPFIYLLFGEERALLIDTGALVDKEKRSLATKVQSIMQQRAKQLALSKITLPLLVAHSHSHGDHIAGDSQFSGLKNTEVIKSNDTAALIASLSLKDWPTKNATIELGSRSITIIPAPGHQAQAIAFYDQQTSWLITGDTIYPGRLYIKHWKNYKNSIQRMVNFTKNHHVLAILGAHIEMSNTPNVDFAMQSTYQENEASLVLSIDDLYKLNNRLITLGEKPMRSSIDNMIIYPLK